MAKTILRGSYKDSATNNKSEIIRYQSQQAYDKTLSLEEWVMINPARGRRGSCIDKITAKFSIYDDKKSTYLWVAIGKDICSQVDLTEDDRIGIFHHKEDLTKMLIIKHNDGYKLSDAGGQVLRVKLAWPNLFNVQINRFCDVEFLIKNKAIVIDLLGLAD